MANIRILGLDDDNHSPCFVGEDGTHFSGVKELVEMLAQRHENTYEVKMFAIVDEWSDELSAHDECEVDHMFDFLEDIASAPEGMTFDELFNLFWNSANRIWW
jgi:hypothetical protein